MRDFQCVQRNPVDLSPGCPLPLLCTYSSSQLLKCCCHLSSSFSPCPPVPSFYFLFSLCSLIPKWNQIWQYAASKISCYGHSLLQKNPCKADRDGTHEPPVCLMHPQLPLFWQPVTWYSHNEELFDILLDPHCSLHDLGYYYSVLFEEHCEYEITNFCKGFSLVFMTAGSEYITKHWIWWAPGFFVHSHFMTMKQTL